MPNLLSAKGKVILDDLPPYFSDDPWVQSIIDTVARELQRVENIVNVVSEQAHPYHADDTYRFLELWETMLHLPVKPVGVSLAARQNTVLATIRTRNAGRGLDWIASVTDSLDSADWEHTEGPVPYTVYVQIPTNVGYTVGTFGTMLRRITPAHIDFNITTALRFIIGAGIQDPNASLIHTDGHVL